MSPRLVRLDHVQLAMPPGEEATAEAFYVGVLGLRIFVKPPILAARGGRWFGNDQLQVHLGSEANFIAARKAHPALAADDLDALANVLDAAGYPVRWSDEIPEIRRFYADDPFGNRIEFVEA